MEQYKRHIDMIYCRAVRFGLHYIIQMNLQDKKLEIKLQKSLQSFSFTLTLNSHLLLMLHSHLLFSSGRIVE